jgi:hypothetical protein
VVSTFRERATVARGATITRGRRAESVDDLVLDPQDVTGVDVAIAVDVRGVRVDIDVVADADPAVATLGREAIERLRKREATPPTDGEQHRYQWRTLKRWPDRLVYATRVATIPSEGDVQSVALPESLAPLYRVVRPARLVARGGRHGVRKLRSQV